MLAATLAIRWRDLRAHPAFTRRPARVLGRMALWSAYCLLRIAPRATFDRLNFTLLVPPIWYGGGCAWPFVFRDDYAPELALLERFLAPGMVVVDGGANIGIYTFAAARLVGPSGRVLAFEPGARCFAALQRSKRINDTPQALLFRQALSDRRTTARLFHHTGQDNSFGLGAPSDDTVASEEVETVTLDETLEQHGLGRLDFIKLDIEGAQEFALRGCRRWLERYRPIILLEIDSAACDRMGLDRDGACIFLATLGYGFYRIDENTKVQPLATPSGRRNVVAVHRSRPLPDP